MLINACQWGEVEEVWESRRKREPHDLFNMYFRLGPYESGRTKWRNKGGKEKITTLSYSLELHPVCTSDVYIGWFLSFQLYQPNSTLECLALSQDSPFDLVIWYVQKRKLEELIVDV